MKRVLTGDRPTGPLHLGHLAGSLNNRKNMLGQHHVTVLIADMQALSDNAHNPQKVSDNVLGILADQIAVGIDPERCDFVLQSAVPELTYLTQLYSNLISVNKLQHIPTIKQEIQQRGFEGSVPLGFLGYPVSQAADITAFNADLVPTGSDQLPLVEITRDLVNVINGMREGTLVSPSCVLSKISRLPGLDGKSKMSKSGNNALFLRDDAKTIKEKVNQMFTDPEHLKVSDPGKTEGNVVFEHLFAFDPDQDYVNQMAEDYRKGGVGDGVTKKRLGSVLQDLLSPVRERSLSLIGDQEFLVETLRMGTRKGRETAQATLARVKAVFGIREI